MTGLAEEERGHDASSPLLEDERVRSFEDTKDIYTATRPFAYILLLTVIIGGLQLSWCAEFSNGTPFLLSLGMSKTLMSLVWIAGPLSGTVGQPIVGVLSDESRARFGRRRPFIIGGGIATIASLLLLSWSKDIIALVFGGDTAEVKARTVPFAVFFVYLLDFSISAIQAAARAYIVDNVPTHQQQIANAWAARMTGIGNIIGYVLGSMNLPQAFPYLGNSQFKVLSACASIALVITVVPACWYIGENDPNTDPSVQKIAQQQEESVKAITRTSKLVQVWRDTVRAISNLSPQTWLICKVQFFAWIGYFPMLFYATTYVGEMYIREYLSTRPSDAPPLTEDEWDRLWEDGTRRGTQALVVYSITSLVANFIFPYLAEASYLGDHDVAVMRNLSHHHIENDSLLGQMDYYKELLLSKVRVKGLTVARVWTYCHVLFIVLMGCTFFITTSSTATVFVGALGVCWACALWAPFTLISEEVSRIRVKKTKAAQSYALANANKQYMRYEHEAGVVLGVMNVFISSPQVISSLFSSLLFKLFSNKANHTDGDSIGWVFRFGGVATILALYFSFFIKSPQQLDREDEQSI
ncbi:hypothetical protein TRICI_002467 [Trichomonascus ciferrii]|uniref:Major facilitator superfamily (MFS) profile domain-containing protein n=1 Tax=Trichomonascus ciferrii TaxID=44093 RepID=A0A642V6P0_9ASCO|nr:hypothetical protein TRICI_002467 [Trichomonascus ciferrii]